MTPPKISLVLTAYNFEKYIVKAVESLLNQRGGYDFEVIVVDDCSPDQTASVLAPLLADKRLRYVRNEKNRGSSETSTIGIRLARGEYIARLDGDDEWYPWFLEETISVLDEHPEVGLAYGDIHTIGENGLVNENAGINRPASMPLQGWEFESLLKAHYLCAPAMMARRSLWEAVLPYPERLKSGLGDWFINLKMAQQAEFRFIPKPLAKYRVHGNGMHYAFVRNGTGEQNMRFILDHFLKNGSPESGIADARKIYAMHYQHFANGYFGSDMLTDARRCYSKAAGFDVSYLWNRQFIFPFLGTLLGKPVYEKLKRLVK